MVTDYLEQWLKRRQVSEKTRVNDAGLCRNHIIPALGHIKLDKLRSVQIQDFISRLQQTKSRIDGTATLSKQTIWHIAKALRKALNDAVAWQYIRRSPFKGVEMPKRGRSEVEFFTKEELAKVLAKAKESDYYIPILIAATSGLRIGEVMALTWSAISFLGNTIRVTQAVQSHSWNMSIGDVKTEYGRRAVPVDPAVMDVLKAHKESIKETAKKNADLWEEHGWVNPNAVGDLINIESVRKAFPKICKRAGVKRCGIHTLRHTYASMMLADGTLIHVLSRRLGHSSIKITVDTYGHIMPHDIDQSVNIFRDML
ncbi:MAG: site-specific integrase [Methylovulum sp.]|jgi:integrase|nr:site-specific integrase [Methylovulum sp.]